MVSQKKLSKLTLMILLTPNYSTEMTYRLSSPAMRKTTFLSLLQVTSAPNTKAELCTPLDILLRSPVL